MQERFELYRNLIRELKQYQQVLGIPEEPNAAMRVPGTGVLLPVYPNNPTDITEYQMTRTLFNLKSMIDFVPPHRPLPWKAS